MRSSLRLASSVGLALGMVAAGAQADVWDVQTQNDNTPASENELVHGSDQLHDLGALPGPAADNDWYQISQKPFSSYEVVVDATSGDIGTGLVVTRTDAGGTTVLQTSVRWASATAGASAGRTIQRPSSTTSASMW